MASTGGHAETMSLPKSKKSDDVHEDKNFHKESVRTLEDLRDKLDDRMEFLKQPNFSTTHHNKQDLEALRSELQRSREVLSGTDKYLRADLQSAITELRDSLHTHSAEIHRKLKQEMVNSEGQEQRSKHELEELREKASEQELLSRMAIEMKELEEMATRMSSQVERLTEAIEAAHRDAEGSEDSLNRVDENSEERMKRERMQREEEENRRRMEEEAMERRRIEEEERRRRMEEEERLRKIEEERLKKEDPRHWPNAILFEADEDSDSLGSGVAGVLRVPENVSLIKTQLDCSTVNLLTNTYHLAEFEELASNMITLKPAAGHDIHLESAVWLAVPCAIGNRTKETVVRIQRVVRKRPPTPPEKVDEEKLPGEEEEGEESDGKKALLIVKKEEVEDEEKEAPWEDSLTRDTTVEGHHDYCRFVETYLRHLPADGVNIVVITRFKRDFQTFNNKGGKLVSTSDHRVSITCPKNGFRLTTDMSIQTIPLDTAVIVGLKERFGGCEQLLGTSPIVRLSASSKPNKVLNYFVTQPTGGSKNRRTETGKGGGGGSDKDMKLPKVTKNSTAHGNNQDNDNEMDFVTLLTKESYGRTWRARDDVPIEFQKDIATFQLPNVVERFIMLRTSLRLEPPELVKIATNLETCLRERPVAILVRQNYHDSSRVVIECCKRENIDRMIEKLKEEKFSEGQPPAIVCLREGDVIEVGFSSKGNIDFLDRLPRRLIFYSSMAACRLSAEIREIDVFAQNALDHFRGNVRLRLLGRNYQAPPNLQINNGGVKTINEPELLCDFIVVLPKPPKQLTQVNRIRLPIKPDGPLSEEYFQQLSTDLGDEWSQVATQLRIGKASVQRITASYSHLDGVEATQRSIKDMLREWFLSSSKSKDKADDLRMALLNAGRNDLAEELATKSRELRQEIEKRQHETSLTKCIQAFCSSQAAVKSWRSVGKALGLREDDVARIAGDQRDATKDMANRMLRRWKEIRGSSATKDNLIVVLRKLKLNEAAGNVSLIR